MSTLPRGSTNATDANYLMMAPADPALEEVVSKFQAAAESLAIAPLDPVTLNELCRQVAVFTAELFPGEMRGMVKNDPEILEDLYFVYRVRATGDLDHLAALNDLWHRRLLTLKGRRPGLFWLSIDCH